MLRPITETIPIAPLKLIALDSNIELGKRVDELIVTARKKVTNPEALSAKGYQEDSYLTEFDCSHLGSGEARAEIKSSVRGSDLFILADVTDSSIHFKMQQKDTMKSPDSHFQDLKRVIAACSGKPLRINIILPFLYESRQHRKSERESLDCALALQELSKMGVHNIITFDVHDPRIQNAIPIQGSDNFFTSYQFIRALFEAEPHLPVDDEHLMIISPNENGMSRAMYYSTVLGVNIGMFYKRRDYSLLVNGIHPIAAHEYLGNDVSGKHVFIINDIISSGKSILEVAKELKKRNAKKIFIAATFGLFTDGYEKFDEYYKRGIFDRIFITNLTYCSPALTQKPYYHCVDLSKYIALIIDTLNNDTSVNEILNPLEKIHELLEVHQNTLR